MKKSLILFTCLLFAGALAAQSVLFPSGTAGDANEALYQKALYAAMNADVHTFTNAIDQFLANDPENLMGHAQKAMAALRTGDEDTFRKAAQSATEAPAGEEYMQIYQEMLGKLLEDPDADVSMYASKMTQAYPDVAEAHMLNSWMHSKAGNTGIALEAAYNAKRVAPDLPAVYNMIGYTQMAYGNMDTAETMFKKYMQMVPDQPNPYDSMGDFLMEKGDYSGAASMYEKAYAMDKNFTISKEKAQKARMKMEAEK